jgi:hypothetical protein
MGAGRTAYFGDAQTLIIDHLVSEDYRAALRRCALNPELFLKLKKQFPGQTSDRNIAVYLERQGFKPDRAALTAKVITETVALIGAESGGTICKDRMSKIAQEAQCRPTLTIRARRTAGDYHDAGPPIGPALLVVMSGARVDIQASVDLEGLKKLRPCWPSTRAFSK